MHFLLTNDDGIHASGLAALEKAVQGIPGASYTVVAPATEQSQCGHRVTTTEELIVHQLDPHHYSVSGTPADCVRIALFALNIQPDFVLSGINAGGNMGQDIYISGTIAGAREAAYHGLPAAAFSHYLIRGREVDWTRVSYWTRDVLQELMATKLADGEFWNVGFPHLPSGEIAMPPRIPCAPCRSPLKASFKVIHLEGALSHHRYDASYAERPADADSDVAICFGGSIAVSKLRV